MSLHDDILLNGKPPSWISVQPEGYFIAAFKEGLYAAAAIATAAEAQHAERVRVLEASIATWRDLFRRALNEANGLTSYVEPRPELTRVECRLTAIEDEARAEIRAALAQQEPKP